MGIPARLPEDPPQGCPGDLSHSGGRFGSRAAHAPFQEALLEETWDWGGVAIPELAPQL